MNGHAPVLLMEMGIAPQSCRLLALLPLVAVAWADGTVQDAEREYIIDLAQDLGGIDSDSVMLLQDWMQHPPSQDYVRKGIDLLVELIHARHPKLDAKLLDRVPVEAEKVASSAGSGLMGLFNKVSRSEQDALTWLRETLDAARKAAEEGDRTDPNAKRDKALTMYGGDDDEDDEEGLIGVFIVTGPPRRKLRVPSMGLFVGSGKDVQVKAPKLADKHFRIYYARRRFYIEVLSDKKPVTVNGERVGKRRLFGGEAIEAAGVPFVFKLADPKLA